MLSLFLIACGPPHPQCLQVKPHDHFKNHIQPFEIAVDVAGRKVWSSSLASANALAVDADTFEVVGTRVVADNSLDTPDIAADGLEAVWVAGNQPPGLVRLGTTDGTRRSYRDLLEGARSVVTLWDGAAVAVGAWGVYNSLVVGFGPKGEPGSPHVTGSFASSVVVLDGGARVGLLLDNATMEVRALPDLQVQSTCALPFRAQRGAQLASGVVVVSANDAIGVAGCNGAAPRAVEIGIENKDVIPLEDGALVLDRIGSINGADPNLGWAWRLDASGDLIEGAGFATGKNTGYGALDPVTGLIWVNSEGSGEIWAMDPVDGAVVARVQTGTFIDGLAMDPFVPGTAYVTGRLSDTFLRTDGVSILSEAEDTRWPYSPVIDLHRDRIWALGQTDARVYGHSLGALRADVTFESGLGPNPLLTFGGLAYHHGRGTLWMAESRADVLMEMDADSGAILTTYDLGGPEILDPDAIGEIMLRVDDASGAVFALRSNDGRMQRIDPDASTLETAWAPEEVVAGLSDGNLVDFYRLSPRRGLLFVGGAAFDLDDLSRRSNRDVAVSQFLGAHPLHEGQWLGVSEDRMSLVRFDDDGRIRGQLKVSLHALHTTLFRIDEALGRLVMTRAQEAYYCPIDLSDW